MYASLSADFDEVDVTVELGILRRLSRVLDRVEEVVRVGAGGDGVVDGVLDCTRGTRVRKRSARTDQTGPAPS